jgi:tricorn protease
MLLPMVGFSINPQDTRMLSQPAISATHLAFIYAEDLWVANADGSLPRRLTVDEGVESSPVFSPDGKLIAFSAQYDGNTDVFVVPVQGGIPTRLTWHPGNDLVKGFTPDGKSVLFTSQRAVFTNRYAQFFTVPVTGGFPTALEVPTAWSGGYSPDGKSIVYNPLSDNFKQWKHYRGGTNSVVWIFSTPDKSAIKIPQPEGGSNDAGPIWIGNTIFFRSDRNGEFNIFSYSTTSKEIKQLTTFKDFPVINMSGTTNTLIFEQAGYLHTYNLSDGSSKKLTIGIAADLLELRARYVKGASYIRSADISPSGSRAVFDFRGDIITVPAEKGDARNITATTGAHEKYPTWSPDGKSIAYFSDESGEYQLYIKSQDGKTAAKAYPLTGAGFYATLRWSPDGKKISFSDNSRALFLFDIASGTTKKIDADELYTPGAFRNLFGCWSPDSKWFAYTKVSDTNFKRIYCYSVDQSKAFPVTDGLSDSADPVIDPTGKYLIFTASTDAGPVINWFDQSNNDMRLTNSIYLLTLQRETISPFVKENDEETGKPDAGSPANASSKTNSFRIDFDGIENRIVDVPIKPGNYQSLGMGKEGELMYIAHNPDGTSTLHKYDIKKRKDSDVVEVDSYTLSADGKKMLYAKGSTWTISNAGEKPESGKGVLSTGDLQVRIDPLAEWPEIFDEAWRINRDYFYDPGMHGADWNAIKKKYAQFLPDLSCRTDLNTLIQWMCSELAVGHHRLTAQGDKLNTAPTVNGGLLGADFSVANNRYQLKKIYGGLNWNPNLRSPLTEPGVNAKVGDYILAVNGKEITAADNLYKFFEATAGKIVELAIGPNPTLIGSRVVNVVPIENELSLRNRDWVEGNLKKVTEATKGQVAYVYVPNTTTLGHEYFKRYFYPQANRKAIIIDERFNGGGQLADYYIGLLQRPYQSHWHLRYGKELKTPTASIQGPKVMLIDETAGSGGDMLPWMFRKFNVGPLVGKRTWGGLVGILGFPEFIDGGGVTAPNLAIWTKDGFIVENVGVAPDIEVEQTPSEILKGRDPQLEKAIEVVMKELEKNPVEEPVRPAFPTRAKQ